MKPDVLVVENLVHCYGQNRLKLQTVQPVFYFLFFYVVLILDMGIFVPEKYFSRQIFPVNSFD